MPHEEDITIDFHVERSDQFVFVLLLTKTQFEMLKEQLKNSNIKFDYLEC